MAIILNFGAEKGGIGKTTSTINVSAALRQKGFKVCVVDMDSQMSLSEFYEAETETSPTVFDVLIGEKNIQEVIQHTPNGDIIPASSELASFGLSQVSLPGISPFLRLQEVLEELRSEYNFICIDSPPSLGIVSINCLAAADRVVIPASPDRFNLRSIPNTLETIKMVQEQINPDLVVEGILLTRFNPRSSLNHEFKEVIKELAEKNDTKVFDTEIRQCMALSHALLENKNIFDYHPASKKSKQNGVDDYLAFTEEMLGEDE